MTCIVDLSDGAGNTFRFESADDRFIDASIELVEGKKGSSATVILADPLLQLFDELPSPTKKSRITLDVWMADGPAQVPPKVFAGYVSGYSTQITNGAITLTVNAADKLKGGRRRAKATIRRFSSAAAFATAIAQENDLTIDLSRADLDGVEFSRRVQDGETDHAMLAEVMAACGHKIKIRGTTLYVEEIGATRDGAAAPEIVLTYGINLVSLDVRVNERTVGRALNVFDFTGEAVNETTESEAVERPTKVQRAGLALASFDTPSFSSQAVLKSKQAQAKAKRVFEGSVTTAGLYVTADTDDIVVIERAGAKLSGVWNVDAVRLSYAEHQTTFGIYNGGA